MVREKNIFKLQYFVKFAIYTVLIGQLWSTINSNLSFIKTTNSKENVFIADCDNTIDFKLDFKKHFKNSVCNLNSHIPFFKIAEYKHVFYYKNIIIAVNHLDIPTPPPDFS